MSVVPFLMVWALIFLDFGLPDGCFTTSQSTDLADGAPYLLDLSFK